MERGSPEYWEWFYGPSAWDDAAIAERWQPDLVLNQDPQLPGTAGSFHGYKGLKQGNIELFESFESVRYHPREWQELPDGRWLVLLHVSGRGQGSGIELEAGEIGNLITFSGNRVVQMDVHLGWHAARQAAGLS